MLNNETLEQVYKSHNKTSILSLTKLKLLDVSNNKLSSVPAIPQLADLTTLNIALNSLQVAAPGS